MLCCAKMSFEVDCLFTSLPILESSANLGKRKRRYITWKKEEANDLRMCGFPSLEASLLSFSFTQTYIIFQEEKNIVLGSRSLWLWELRRILFVVLNYPGICTILHCLWFWRPLIMARSYLLNVAFIVLA